MDTTLNIGAASRASSVSAKMIRYYERIGLIPPPVRSDSGYRHYTGSDVHTLRFIARARELGFGIAQIGTLLALWRDRTRSSAEVKRIALSHVEELHRRIAALQAMAATLQHLAGHCHGDERPDCPILDDLSGHTEPPGQRPGTQRSTDRPRVR